MFLIPVGISIGSSLVRRFLPVELCPQISRSKTVSFVVFLDAFVTIIVLILYPPMTHKFGNGIMFFFTIISGACFIFLYKYLPETLNKTVTENISNWLPPNQNVEDENCSLISRNSVGWWSVWLHFEATAVYFLLLLIAVFSRHLWWLMKKCYRDNF